MSIPPFLFFSVERFSHLKALQVSQLSEKKRKIEKSSKRATTAPSDGLKNRLIRPNTVADRWAHEVARLRFEKRPAFS